MMIDSHTHMPSPGWAKHQSYYSSVEEAVRYMRKIGISRAIFNTWRGVLSETAADVDIANAKALEYARSFDGFLYPGAAMNPLFPDVSLKWLKEFHKLGYRWAGELLTYSCEPKIKYTDPEFLAIAEECAKLGFIVQLHCEREVLDLAKSFPSLLIVCSHIADDDFLGQLALCKNVWLDISGSAGGLHMGRLEKAYELFTSKRLLFGSDFTGYDPQCFIARVKTVIPGDEQDDVFSGNVISLLDRVGAKPII